MLLRNCRGRSRTYTVKWVETTVVEIDRSLFEPISKKNDRPVRHIKDLHKIH